MNNVSCYNVLKVYKGDCNGIKSKFGNMHGQLHWNAVMEAFMKRKMHTGFILTENFTEKQNK